MFGVSMPDLGRLLAGLFGVAPAPEPPRYDAPRPFAGTPTWSPDQYASLVAPGFSLLFPVVWHGDVQLKVWEACQTARLEVPACSGVAVSFAEDGYVVWCYYNGVPDQEHYAPTAKRIADHLGHWMRADAGVTP